MFKNRGGGGGVNSFLNDSKTTLFFKLCFRVCVLVCSAAKQVTQGGRPASSCWGWCRSYMLDGGQLRYPAFCKVFFIIVIICMVFHFVIFICTAFNIDLKTPSPKTRLMTRSDEWWCTNATRPMKKYFSHRKLVRSAVERLGAHWWRDTTLLLAICDRQIYILTSFTSIVGKLSVYLSDKENNQGRRCWWKMLGFLDAL